VHCRLNTLYLLYHYVDTNCLFIFALSHMRDIHSIHCAFKCESHKCIRVVMSTSKRCKNNAKDLQFITFERNTIANSIRSKGELIEECLSRTSSSVNLQRPCAGTWREEYTSRGTRVRSIFPVRSPRRDASSISSALLKDSSVTHPSLLQPLLPSGRSLSSDSR